MVIGGLWQMISSSWQKADDGHEEGDSPTLVSSTEHSWRWLRSGALNR